MKSSNRGFGQIELILTVGVIMAASAGIFGYAKMAQNDTADALLANDVAALAHSLHNAYGMVGSYALVSNQRVIEERLAPAGLLDGAALVSDAGAFTIQPITVDGRPDAGFRLTFSEAGKERCASLVTELADAARFVRVDNYDVAVDGRVYPVALTQACDHPTPAIALDYYEGKLGQSGVVAPALMPLAPAPVTTPTPQPNPMAVVASNGSQLAPVRPLPEQCYSYPETSPGTCGAGTHGSYTWQRDETQPSCWKAVAHCFTDEAAMGTVPAIPAIPSAP